MHLGRNADRRAQTRHARRGDGRRVRARRPDRGIHSTPAYTPLATAGRTPHASCCCARSALGARYAPDRLGGIVAGPVLFGSAIIALVLPGRWNLLVTEPQGPLWNHAHALWRGVLAWGVIVLAVASRDVWRRNPFRARRRSSRDLAQRRTQAARPRLTNPATWKGPDATDRAVSEGEDIEASPLGPLRQ